ncbi:hypothetical protein [Streptoalloteichus hindustanus]|uniref:hypothetical protein n=1 Tax=Streptoalloteichus hindustanus TaxID=2017 RepID=UPI00190E8E0C|nr:hypothetical protein [Streptoalloteichus hindustanus]
MAVLGAIVQHQRSVGASFEAGLNSAFVAAGAVTLTSPLFTGLWLVKSKPAKANPPTTTTQP